MSFREKHPYLFWQLIGWGILIAAFGFFMAAALCEFGEWCYPIIVFTFIFGLFFVAVSPIAVKLKRRRLVPQNDDEGLERVLGGKISAINIARHGLGVDALGAFLAFGSVIGFIFAAYILGERVSLALGFACMVLAVTSPFIIIGIYSKRNAKLFFKVKNGEKRIDFQLPADLAELGQTNPRTLLINGEPSDVLLNLFYNWLAYYIKEENGERLVLYKVPAPELCSSYTPANFLGYGDILLCIPEEQFDLIGEKLALFHRECDIMSALPFGVFAKRSGDT